MANKLAKRTGLKRLIMKKKVTNGAAVTNGQKRVTEPSLKEQIQNRRRFLAEWENWDEIEEVRLRILAEREDRNAA